MITQKNPVGRYAVEIKSTATAAESPIHNPKFAPPVTSYSLPATAAAPQSPILQILSSCLKFTQNPKSKIQNLRFLHQPPVTSHSPLPLQFPVSGFSFFFTPPSCKSCPPVKNSPQIQNPKSKIFFPSSLFQSQPTRLDRKNPRHLLLHPHRNAAVLVGTRNPTNSEFNSSFTIQNSTSVPIQHSKSKIFLSLHSPCCSSCDTSFIIRV